MGGKKGKKSLFKASIYDTYTKKKSEMGLEGDHSKNMRWFCCTEDKQSSSCKIIHWILGRVSQPLYGAQLYSPWMMQNYHSSHISKYQCDILVQSLDRKHYPQRTKLQPDVFHAHPEVASVQHMKRYRVSWMTFSVDLCWHNANSLFITTLHISVLSANVTREACACQPACLYWKLELPFQRGEKNTRRLRLQEGQESKRHLLTDLKHHPYAWMHKQLVVFYRHS